MVAQAAKIADKNTEAQSAIQESEKIEADAEKKAKAAEEKEAKAKAKEEEAKAIEKKAAAKWLRLRRVMLRWKAPASQSPR